ncbi:thiosulfate/3-mercaptopyruvate sulfurtransferase [Desulfuromusa kysingii]|uniref:Thiosulfate/3-mercaptopyruvate sulfurtransferase n=1 Tax=Desulfuromusa kysingii TaxID=37625 RepID=A0A1H3XDR5_9BACT|nr:rhodanese-like domain-containing protein [Desulfuromusa kysingii]SDZ96742.1 thiosulfate/3-mercaptopyruvate sulfurtransferase [Desulfuromusa kysingii]
MTIPLLVSPEWLQENLNNSQIQVIENPRNKSSYLQGHIPGAVCSPTNPHLKRYDTNGEKTQYVMTADEFQTVCHDLGLKRDKHYIIYDDENGLLAARFRCVCRHFGVDNVSILDGSGRGWISQQRPVSKILERPEFGSDMIIKRRENYFIGWKELRSWCQNPEVQIWDARREAEYWGIEETKNLRRGHLPGARHCPWSDLLLAAPSEGAAEFLKSNNELERMLTDLGFRRDKTIVTYCQSGIRAAFCVFVLELLGYPQYRLYDASMGEWSCLRETPLVL